MWYVQNSSSARSQLSRGYYGVPTLTLAPSLLQATEDGRAVTLRIVLSLQNFLGSRADSSVALVTVEAQPVPAVAILSNAVTGSIFKANTLTLFAQVHHHTQPHTQEHTHKGSDTLRKECTESSDRD